MALLLHIHHDNGYNMMFRKYVTVKNYVYSKTDSDKIHIRAKLLNTNGTSS